MSEVNAGLRDKWCWVGHASEEAVGRDSRRVYVQRPYAILICTKMYQDYLLTTFRGDTELAECLPVRHRTRRPH